MSKEILLFTIFLYGCSSMGTSNNVGLKNNILQLCPSSPNCVCSDQSSNDKEHYIKPIIFTGDSNKAFLKFKEMLEKLPQVEVQKKTDEYIHLTIKSSLFGFIDDVEFHLRPRENIIAVRSASRVGYSDLGVNRKRIESIRKKSNFEE